MVYGANLSICNMVQFYFFFSKDSKVPIPVFLFNWKQADPV